MIRKNFSSFEFEKQKIAEVIIPIGSYEQHGLHATLATDSIIAYEIADLLAEATGIYVCPPISYGCSALHLGHGGTISISSDAFINYVSDIVESLISSGIKKIYFVNGHGGNILSLKSVIERYANQIEIVLLNWWIIGRELNLFSPEESHHAGSLETSMLLVFDESYVSADLLVDNEIVEYNPYSVKRIDDITPTGSIGVATTASKERGLAYLDALINYIVVTFFDS